jgi:hypothetical protein
VQLEVFKRKAKGPMPKGLIELIRLIADLLIKVSNYLVIERKAGFWVGWVEPEGLCWVSPLNPTYEIQAVKPIVTILGETQHWLRASLRSSTI